MSRVVAIRALGLYLPLFGAILAWAVRRPQRPQATGALLATAWNLPLLLAINQIAIRAGWWRFDVSDATLFAFPVDLWIGWSVFWGVFAALCSEKRPTWISCIQFLLLDLVFMPLCAPVVILSRSWLIGEALALLTCLLPGLFFARLTREDRHVWCRSAMQAVCFIGLLAVLVAVRLQQRGILTSIAQYSWLRIELMAGLLVLAGLPGLSALQEFAIRGHGTPLPFDPPKKLVTSGIYAYVANPMQTSTALVLLVLAALFQDLVFLMAALMSLMYSMGIAAWDEGNDLRDRFAVPFAQYRGSVRNWVPRWRPFVPETATIYISAQCGKCSELATFLRALHPVGLRIVPAEQHPRRDLVRITYEAADGSEETGIHALARALEHVNLLCALLLMWLRLPVISSAVQMILDASGGGPMLVSRNRCELPRT
jgi:protein-S-isoprenylcysteine O-methyltransferase Ste14